MNILLVVVGNWQAFCEGKEPANTFAMETFLNIAKHPKAVGCIPSIDDLSQILHERAIDAQRAADADEIIRNFRLTATVSNTNCDSFFFVIFV
jgi:hypothetical protein